MSKVTTQALIAIAAILIVGLAFAFAGSQGSVQFAGGSLFWFCVVLAFTINWLVFIPAFLAKSEHYFDATGTATYLSTVALAIIGSNGSHWRGQLLAFLIAFWALRLGVFLFNRIKDAGGDGRFDKLKMNFFSFFMVWSLQALWVLITVGAALAAMTSVTAGDLGWTTLLGLVLFVVGMAIEVEADNQKSVFRQDPANEDAFITTGLWAWSRHPNYFGEIVLWLGIAFIALPALHGWQLVTLISPIFVYVLLTRISGIPLLEARGKRRWGQDPEYQAYKERTPALILWPPKGNTQMGAEID